MKIKSPTGLRMSDRGVVGSITYIISENGVKSIPGFHIPQLVVVVQVDQAALDAAGVARAGAAYFQGGARAYIDEPVYGQRVVVPMDPQGADAARFVDAQVDADCFLGHSADLLSGRFISGLAKS